MPVREFTAVTDRGREVQLYRLDQDAGTGTRAFSRGSAGSENDLANCHGWVFTGGQHLLSGDGVERILEDNGYRPCLSPQVGDLIIYRNSEGAIWHTGLIAGMFLGMPMIESKWGLGARLVHSPVDQPYGERFSFYRSERQGHVLAIVPAKSVMSTASR